MSENKQTNSYLTSNCRNIYHIDKFKIPNDEITEMFPRAYALPTFFTHNLLSNNRIVKVFTGPDALLRVFYFQLMKLALEVEVQEIDYSALIKRKLIKYELFEQGQLQDTYFSDFQYRKFLKDFIEIVQADEMPNFQQKIQMYPIIDEILLKQLKMLIPIPILIEIFNHTNSDLTIIKQILQPLCQLFDITLTQIDRCFKFEQSDIFLYVQNRDQLYVAYSYEQPSTSQIISSQFKSSFQCGQGNSFITKYRSKCDSSKKIDNAKSQASNQAFTKIKTNSYKQTFLSQNTPQHQHKRKDQYNHNSNSNNYGNRYSKNSNGNGNNYGMNSNDHPNSKNNNRNSNDNNFGKNSNDFGKNSNDFGKNSNDFGKNSNGNVNKQNLKSQQSLHKFFKNNSSQSQSTHSNINQMNSKLSHNNNSFIYKQFTDSAILGAMDNRYVDNIRKIKNKYQKRQNIWQII